MPPKNAYSTRSNRAYNDYEDDDDEMTIQEIGKAIKSMQTSIQKQLSDIFSEQKKITERIEIIEEKQKRQHEEIRRINNEKNTEIWYLKKKINDLEYNTKKKNIIISGVPADENENLFDVLHKIQNAVDTKIEDSDVMAIHRLGRQSSKEGSSSTPKPPGIIVAFKNTQIKDKLMENKNIKKITTTTLNYPGPSRNIYINDQLTEQDTALFEKARKYKIDQEFKYVWTKRGRILMRKTDGSRILHIKSEEDLPRKRRSDDTDN